jgi:hypothetical protein
MYVELLEVVIIIRCTSQLMLHSIASMSLPLRQLRNAPVRLHVTQNPATNCTPWVSS